MTTLKRRLAQHKRFPLRSVVLAPPAADADWASAFSTDPGRLWLLPEPVRFGHRPAVPMTREQSRAWRRIQRVAKVKDRWERKRRRQMERVMIDHLAQYPQRWMAGPSAANLMREYTAPFETAVRERLPVVQSAWGQVFEAAARHHALLAPEVQ